MVVCLCQGVSEKRVRVAIAQGACTRKQVTRSCGAGAGCGGCHQAIEKMVFEGRRAAAAEQREVEPHSFALAAPAV